MSEKQRPVHRSNSARMMTVLNFEQSGTNDSNANKRPAAQSASTEPTKKRAPYAPRACDACRRRKGRCSGGDPCTYCFARSLHCGGADNTTPHMYGYEAAPEMTTDHEPGEARGLLTASRSSATRSQATNWSRRSELDTFRYHDNSAPFADLIANLQKQVGTLTSRLRVMESKNGSCESVEARTANEDSGFETARSLSEGASDVRRVPASPRQRLARKSVHRKRFCGPTSPDYSLNVAQIQLHQGGLGGRLNEGDLGLPSINDNQSDDEESLSDDDNKTASGLASGRALEKLTGFRRLLSKDDASRLVQTYREVFDNFHPILDVSTVGRQVEAWYDEASGHHAQTHGRFMHGATSGAAPSPATNEHTLLIINLVLAIALCAEPSSDVDIGKAIYAYCKEAIHRSMICPAPDLNNAVIALLVGTYHFFRDQVRFAWRMCGLAGNILLELGLHGRDFPEHILGPECNRARVISIVCTTIVLDRQWSAATGLPTHVQQSHFKSAMKSSIGLPYLKAMVSFMAVSDKYTSAFSLVASKGKDYEEDDGFEVLNFQIEQWRKNSLGQYNMIQDGAWSSLPLEQIPSWAILLNLRANAAHSMLLRPFFFTKLPTSGSRRNIEPALRYCSDTINILSSLDKSTNVYRMQLPFYVHLLASACALMSLVTVHIAQNREALKRDLPDDFATSLSRSFRNAMAIASRYASTSRASQKLQKRLGPIADLLIRLSILPGERQRQPQRPIAEGGGSTKGLRTSNTPSRLQRPDRNVEPEMADSLHTKGDSQAMVINQIPNQPYDTHDTTSGAGSANSGFYYPGDVLTQPMPSSMMMELNGGASSFESHSPIGSMPFGHNGSSFGQWPLVGGDAFFSEGELLFDE